MPIIITILMMIILHLFFKKLDIPFFSIVGGLLTLCIFVLGFSYITSKGWLQIEIPKLKELTELVLLTLTALATCSILHTLFKRVWSTFYFVLLIICIGVGAYLYQKSITIIPCIILIGIIYLILCWKITRVFIIPSLDSGNLLIHIGMFVLFFILPPVGMLLIGVLPFKYEPGGLCR